MRKLLAALFAALALAVAAAGTASADPAFGPGQSGSNGNQVCHPPGQVSDLPQCK